MSLAPDSVDSSSKNNKLPRFFLLNAISLVKTNVKQVLADVCTSRVDIVLLVETWFT
jgi:hypothetical protein